MLNPYAHISICAHELLTMMVVSGCRWSLLLAIWVVQYVWSLASIWDLYSVCIQSVVENVGASSNYILYLHLNVYLFPIYALALRLSSSPQAPVQTDLGPRTAGKYAHVKGVYICMAVSD